MYNGIIAHSVFRFRSPTTYQPLILRCQLFMRISSPSILERIVRCLPIVLPKFIIRCASSDYILATDKIGLPKWPYCGEQTPVAFGDEIRQYFWALNYLQREKEIVLLNHKFTMEAHRKIYIQS